VDTKTKVTNKEKKRKAIAKHLTRDVRMDGKKTRGKRKAMSEAG